MNRKALMLIFSGYIFVTVLISTLAFVFLSRSGTHALEVSSMVLHEKYLSQIIDGAKNDLLSGNYRFFRVQIARLIEQDLFSDYQLKQNGIALDASEDFESNRLSGRYSVVRVPIWFDNEKTSLWGNVDLLVKKDRRIGFVDEIKERFKTFLMLVVVLLMTGAILSFFYWQSINQKLSAALEVIFSDKEGSEAKSTLWAPVITQVSKLKEEHDLFRQKSFENEKKALLGDIAKQVAHDIRSPLMALDIALRDTSGLSEERRTLLEQANHRIKTIAEDLLSKSRESKVTPFALPHITIEEKKADGIGSFDITRSIEGIVVEKKTTYPHVDISTSGLNSRLLVVGVTQDFERLFSNLLQNAIDAVGEAHEPKVQVALRSYGKKIQVSIMDNGKGIPADILSRIGEEGFSYGKELGNGLGVFLAKKKISQWNGEIAISSKDEYGTLVELSLNSEKTVYLQELQ